MRRLILIVGLVLASVAGCQSAIVTPTPSPTPAPTAAPTATPTPTPTAEPTSTVDPLATPTPLPTAEPGAAAAITNYEEYVQAGRFADAWAMIGKGSQAKWGTLAKYTAERTAFLAKAGSQYRIMVDPRDTLPMSDWLDGVAWVSFIDQPNAFIITVEWLTVTDPAKQWEIWVATPVAGGWQLYLIR